MMRTHLTIAFRGESTLAWGQAACRTLAGVPGVVLGQASDACDAVLDFTGRHVPERMPPLGVWRFEFAGRSKPEGAGLRALGAGALETALWSHGGDGVPLCLIRSPGALEPYALRRSTRQAVDKAALFPARAAQRILAGATLQDLDAEARRIDVPPAFTTALQGVAPAALAWLQKARHKLAHREQWFIALERTGQRGLAGAPRAPSPIYPPPDRFWADPFLAQHAGRTWLFVEELLFADDRGHIAAMEIDDMGRAGPSMRVLERPYHLSYPFVFEWDGMWWMLPETSHNRTVELYRCESFPDRWVLEKVLLHEVRAADSTLWQHEGRWWLFASMAAPGASIHDELHLYHADSPLGPWQAHPHNPVKSDARSSRPAGALFRAGEDLIRPAQDCGTAYGRAIALNRVETLTPDDYCETRVGGIAPGWQAGVARTHTLNQAGGWRVLDALRYLPRTTRQQD